MDLKKLNHIVLYMIAAILLVYITRAIVPAVDDLELKSIDWRYKWRGVETLENSPIVLVTIDDYSFEALPDRWPWPRSYYAKAVDNLKQAGAKVVGIDVIFDVADKLGASKDSLFATAIKDAGNVVLARKLEQNNRLASYKYLVEPIPLLQNAVGGSMGLASVQSDRDGIYRRYPVLQEFNGEYITAFAIEVLRKYDQYPADTKMLDNGSLVKFGDYQMSLYDRGSFLINYPGPSSTFPSYSFGAVVDDSTFVLPEGYNLNYFSENLLPDGVFKDKIVLIGSTVAEHHDNFPTPFLEYDGVLKETPGVEILASALHTILTNQYYHPISGWISFFTVIALVVLIGWVVLRLHSLVSIGLTVGILLGYFAITVYLFVNYHLLLEMITPILGIGFGYISASLYQFVLLQKEKQRIMGAFQHYVPEKVVKELIEHPEKLALGGEERVMTVLFSDVAGFTTISESLTPRELVELINEYLSEMTEIVLQHDGIIDKYEGDAIMAEFGAPVFYKEHALKACYVSLDMQKRLKELGRVWRRTGKPVLTCRTGINTGNMIVGNMGSKKVFDYTVLGDAVNLAARLEGANKAFGTMNMISESTYQDVKEHMVTRPLDRLIVKGKSKPVQVYELIARKEDELDRLLKAVLPMYSEGIVHYENRQWEKGIEVFEKCLQLIPDDGPSRTYLKRCQDYLDNPPSHNWDGVFALKSK